MLPHPPSQSLLDAMAALGWRTTAATADAQQEIAALDRAAALRLDVRRTSLDEIRRHIHRQDHQAEASQEPLEMPCVDDEFRREAARADEGIEKLELPPDILERMQHDQEHADREKGGPTE